MLHGRTARFSYDLRGNVTQIQAFDGSITRYEYDLNDNLIRIVNPEGVITTFRYDAENRLIARTEDERISWQYELDKIGNIIAITDPLGAITKYEYDKNGNLIRATNPAGGYSLFTYDEMNRITEMQDENGNTTIITHDALSQITSITMPEGGRTQFLYDAIGNLIKEKDSLGHITTFEYDSVGNLIRTISPRGAITEFRRNLTGDIIEEIDAHGNSTRNTFNLAGLITEMVLPNGATFNYEYDELQRLIKVRAPENTSRQFIYDNMDNIIKEIDSLGNATTFTYDIMGRMLTATNAENRTTTFEYDRLGNLTSVVSPTGNRTTYAHDILGRVTSETNPMGLVTRFERDVLGNLTAVDRSGGRITRYSHDAVGNVTSITNALGHSERFEYNRENMLIRHTDLANNVTEFAYDLRGQLVKIADSQGITRLSYDAHGNIERITNRLGYTTNFGHDLLDRLTSVTDANGNITRYTYDTVGNLTAVTNANGHITRFEYDMLGRKILEENALGRITRFEYDAMSNLRQITNPDGRSIRFNYNKINELISRESEENRDVNAMYILNGEGQLVRMYDTLGTHTYEHNAAGQLTKVITSTGQTIRYDYDELGRLSRLIYPDGLYVRYEYNLLDQLTAVIDRQGNVTTYTYDPFGRLSKVIRPNRTLTIYHYNEQGLLYTVINKRENGEVISKFQYKYNAEGQIIAELARNGNLTTQRTFEYDPIGQLIGYVEVSSRGVRAVYFAYDNVGNRGAREAFLNQVSIGRTEYAHNEANQLITQTQLRRTGDRLRTTGVTRYTYDLNGNLIAEARANGVRTTFEYDVLNRLTAVTTNNVLLMAMVYDGRDERAFSVNRRIEHYTVEHDEDEEEYEVEFYEEEEDEEELPDSLPNLGGRISLFWYAFMQAIVNLFTGGNQSLQVLYNRYLNDNWEKWVQRWHDSRVEIEPMWQREIAEVREELIEILEEDEEPDIEDLILIPLGISHHQRNRWDLVEYINDITFENTQVLMETTNRRMSAAYTYGIERLTFEDTRMRRTSHYMHDGTTSVANLTNQMGMATVRYSYDPFGVERRAGGTNNRFSYNAEHVDLTGLQYLRARYYNPNKARFISADPFRGFIDLPISQNRYTYVHNDPMNHIDPTGMVFARIGNAVRSVANTVVSGVQRVGNAIMNVLPSPVRNVINTGVNVVRSGVQTVVSGAKNFANAVSQPNQTLAQRINSGVQSLATIPNTFRYNFNVNQANSLHGEARRLEQAFHAANTPEQRLRIARQMEALTEELRRLCETAERIQPQLLQAGHKNLQPIPSNTINHNLPGITQLEVEVAIAEFNRIVAEAHSNNTSWWENFTGYMARSGNQIILGEFTDDITLLGTAGQIALGFFGLDAPMDIRDLTANVVNWEWTWSHAGNTGLNLIGLLPVVGVFRYTDEVVDLARGANRLDNAADTARRADNIVDTAQSVANPNIGNKLEYVFGNATGNSHNIQRSVTMERQLNSIGIFDNSQGRSLMERNLAEAFRDSSNAIIQPNGRVMRESLVSGPDGILKMQSVWEGDRLITVILYGGR